MNRRNFMTDDATIKALDRFRSEVKAQGGTDLSRSQVLRAMVCGLDGALHRLSISFPGSETELELRDALGAWIVFLHSRG